jgi:hypothetical protein
MNEPGPEHEEAVRTIASILAGAYLRLRYQDQPPPPVDCPGTKSESCDVRLTP